MPQSDGDAFDGLDLGQLEQLVVLADGSVLAGLVERFPATVAMGEQVESALASGDVTQARATAHQLAGRALNLGAARAGQIAREIVAHLDTGRHGDAQALVPRLRAALERAQAGLRAYLAGRS